ncbi:unnamed protein product [Echinostoma caproni]|uniref:RGS domain-containing protein n=1 Tax=Echinostoma caproni TaxID=27848 RepID=A0A183A6W7_9TREM|nr:unnamed protein product [Echinostoma caproni]
MEDQTEEETCTELEALDGFYRHVHTYKMEQLIGHFNNPKGGLQFEHPSDPRDPFNCCFSGSDLVQKIHDLLNTADQQEALHLANFFLHFGYIYPVSTLNVRRVKADPAMKFRMQAPCFWPSNFSKPDDVDYAVYLCKQKLKRSNNVQEEYEEQALETLKNSMLDKWEAICLQAREQIRVDRLRLKEDRVVLFLQERAYWRIHRPPPNRPDAFLEDIQRNFTLTQMRARQKRRTTPAPSKNLDAAAEETISKSCENPVNRHRSTVTDSSSPTDSHNLENLINYANTNMPSDAFANHLEYESPWLKTHHSDSDWPTDCTGCSATSQLFPLPLPGLRQIRMWAVTMENLLNDSLGRSWLEWFMQKEHSCENIRFWLAVDSYRFGPLSAVATESKRIFQEYIADTGCSEVNVDDKIKDVIKESINVN